MKRCVDTGQSRTAASREASPPPAGPRGSGQYGLPMTGAASSGGGLITGAVIAALISGVVAMVGHLASRRATKEVQERWEKEFRAANTKWLTEGREAQERWEQERTRERERWERDRVLDVLHRAVDRACSAQEPLRAVGQAQLRHLRGQRDRLEAADLELINVTAAAALRPVLNLEADEVRVDSDLESPMLGGEQVSGSGGDAPDV